jgi:hypothetical protein
MDWRLTSMGAHLHVALRKREEGWREKFQLNRNYDYSKTTKKSTLDLFVLHAKPSKIKSFDFNRHWSTNAAAKRSSRRNMMTSQPPFITQPEHNKPGNILLSKSIPQESVFQHLSLPLLTPLRSPLPFHLFPHTHCRRRPTISMSLARRRTNPLPEELQSPICVLLHPI